MTDLLLPQLVLEVADPTTDPAPLIGFRWATITSIDPLRVRYDGESTELPMTPECLVDPARLAVTDRVWVQSFGLRRIVLGRSNEGPRAIENFLSQAQASFRLTGLRDVTLTGVSWEPSGLIISGGKGPQSAANGFFYVNMPAAGTVVPVLGSNLQTGVTVGGGVIPLEGWQSLYYALPLGNDETSIDGAFVIVDYTNTGVTVEVPSSWVLVAKHNNNGWPDVIWGDGQQQSWWRPFNFSAGWSNFNGGYEVCGYKQENGWVELQGTAKGGSGNVGVLPSGCWPRASRIFVVSANVGFARVSLTNAGVLGQSTLSAGATTATFNLDGIRYQAAG